MQVPDQGRQGCAHNGAATVVLCRQNLSHPRPELPHRLRLAARLVHAHSQQREAYLVECAVIVLIAGDDQHRTGDLAGRDLD